MNTDKIAQLNREWYDLSPQTIVSNALDLGKTPVLTTNFRPYESAIIHLVASVIPEIPVIWCDTGYNTRETYTHAEFLIRKLHLNISLYVPQQTSAYRNAVMGIPELDTPEHDEFTKQVKLEPFQRAMREHQPDIWFTNLRKGQTAFRDDLDILSTDSSRLLKVSPFYFWNDERLDTYLNEHALPNEFNYFDPTKVLGNRECGLHTR